ncbi:MAG: ATP-binding protein [Bacteroidales bacterium]|nr:ATP-binding protein [Bacteroidales bacterium]
MNLYYREEEIKLLQRQLWLSKEQRSRMTVLSGRRGTGKTALVAAALPDEPYLYFRMGGKTEHLLLQDFIQQVRQKLELFVPSKVLTVELLLSFLMDSGYKHPLTLVIDHFDEWVNRQPDAAEFLRELWDSKRRGTHVNMILIAENKSVIEQTFDREDSPLVNAPDCRIELRYFSVMQLRNLLLSMDKTRTSEDLLALYLSTGGMPTLTLDVLNATKGDKEQIYNYLLSSHSPLHARVGSLLGSTIGKNSEVYLSILQLIASGIRTQAEIEEQLGGIIIGGHLAKLETEYQLITKSRPILSEKNSRNVVRFQITDLFLSFWLKYVEANRSTIHTQGYQPVIAWAMADFETAGQEALVRYFMQKFSEQHGLRIGGDWSATKPSRAFSRRREYYMTKKRKEKPAQEPDHEIDIIAIEDKSHKALVADVCLNARDFKKAPFLDRLAVLKKGPLKGYVIDSRVFTIEDM